MVSRKGTEIRELQLLSKEGGQGVVYRVNCGGRECALKIYRRALSDNLRFRANLIENTKHDPPDESFIWPLDVVENIRAVDESGSGDLYSDPNDTLSYFSLDTGTTLITYRP